MIESMTNEEKLDRMLKLTEENNRILRSLHRTQTVSNIFRILYWTLIIASLGGAYYFIKPLITEFTGSANSSGGLYDQINMLKTQLPEARALQEMLKGMETQ